MFAEIFLVTHKGITRLLNRHVFLFVVSLSNVDTFLSAAQLPTFDYKKLSISILYAKKHIRLYIPQKAYQIVHTPLTMIGGKVVFPTPAAYLTNS